MGDRGKKSVAALSVAPVTVEQRLSPPLGLTDEQKAVWVSVINARPAEWFGDEHIGALTQYCRHVVQAENIAEQLANFNMAWLADGDGLERYEKLLKMQERETRAITALARSMRITNQSLYDPKKAVKSKRSAKPWE